MKKGIALELQSVIRKAFSDAFPVFVSSDPKSLGGGEEWFHHILENLSKARLVLVLLSPDSLDRPWINFEAGFGKGQKSRVIPVLSFDSIQYLGNPGQGEYDSGAIPNGVPGSSRTGFRDVGEHRFRDEAEQFQADPGTAFCFAGILPAPPSGGTHEDGTW